MNKKQIIAIGCGMAAILLLDLIDREGGFNLHLGLLIVVTAIGGLIYALRDKKVKDTKDDQ